MQSRRLAGVTMSILLVWMVLAIVPVAQRAADPSPRPGPLGRGVTLLPNGWRIAPAGHGLAAGDFPMSMVAAPDGRHLIISNNGWSRPTLTVVDTRQMYVKAKVPVDHAWLGLAWNRDGNVLYSSGAAENTVKSFEWTNGELRAADSVTLLPPATKLPSDLHDFGGTGFIGGLAVSADGRTLYAVHVLGRAVSAIDLASRQVTRTVTLPAEPYTALLSRDGATLYISLWGGAKVLALDPATLAVQREVAVGEHPNAMALSRDGARLFVACANTNKVWALDLPALTAREQISVALFPNAPPGTTPNALDISPDGKTLVVANADNNTVAWVDIDKPGASEVEGFLPTGWYPTSVLFDRNGRRLYVLNGKGFTGQPNPRGPQPTSPAADGQYIGQLLQGTLSVIDVPDRAGLKVHTQRAYDLTAYTDAKRLTPSNPPNVTPIPKRVGDPSPIKYVFYVIRENRTYDQILGDLEKGNGDPTLTIFGDDVTPNVHALARDYTVLDNFYVDAEVSYDGHAFSTGAYATDVVEKLWPTNYGRRGAGYLSEGGWGDRNEYGNLSAPPAGYIWDFATRANISVRSYGEFAERSAPGRDVEATVPGLKGKVHPSYPPYDLGIADGERVDVWLKEFREFEQRGGLPRLNIIRLGNDHTYGTTPGRPTPRAMVAENDAAVGRLVEAISSSRYWNESAIFIVEDDAQNGPDHVDSHRSVGLVISPFVRRQAVDSTLYTTSSVLRTMELILGLPPMSQYDAAATPMYNAFQATARATPFKALPARIPLDEKNDADAFGAAASLAMNFVEADMTPEYELNEIIWRSVRGAHAAMPPPVRAGFIRVVDADEERMGCSDPGDPDECEAERAQLEQRERLERKRER